jgi:ferredoxin, 2Fe-2S
MPTLKVTDRNGTEHTVDTRTGRKVMEVLRDLDYGVAATCGGMCSCATCHVYVDTDWFDKLPTAGIDERELLSALTHCRSNSRLSCQVEVTPASDGLTLAIAPDE